MSVEPEIKLHYPGKIIIRVCGASLLTVCCVMVLLGLTVLANHLEGRRYLVYWSWCFLFALLAAVAAGLDLIMIRRAGRLSREELLRQQFLRKG